MNKNTERMPIDHRAAAYQQILDMNTFVGILEAMEEMIQNEPTDRVVEHLKIFIDGYKDQIKNCKSVAKLGRIYHKMVEEDETET